MSERRIVLTAGEASSDAHGAGLVRALRARGFSGDFYGIGGPALAEAGLQCVARAEELAVVGLVEALRVVPTALGLLRRLGREFRENPPDLFIPVDSPDFNLRLCKSAHRAGVPTLYFVAPQLWAWRAGRVKQLREHVRELLVLFPFEQEWFTQRGVRTSYVGHPLVDAARSYEAAPDLRSRLGFKEGERIGLLLPGSRGGEVARHFPLLARSAERVSERFPEVCWVTRMAEGLTEEAYQPWAGQQGIRLSRAPLFDLASLAEVAAAVSGTASFEVALMGTPLVVLYRMNLLSWWLARRMVKVPWAAMANLTAGRGIVPERIQTDCTPDHIAGDLLALLGNPARAAAMKADLLSLRDRFGPPGAYGRAADRVLAILEDERKEPPA